jgi:glucose/arabinose dehydrogenase
MAFLAAAALIGGCASRQSDQTASPPLPQATAAKIPVRKSVASRPIAIERIDEVPDGVKQANGLTVPRGFRVEIFADKLDGPRRLLVVPRGNSYDVLVAESNANRVRLLRDADGDGRAEARPILLSGQSQPYGLALQNGQLYVGNNDGVVRAPYVVGATNAGAPRKLLDMHSGGHWKRNLLFSRDGKKWNVADGSSCNVCEEKDNRRAAILEMNPDGTGQKIFASGLRNPVGIAWRPGTDELWTVVNERDNLGDDFPPDYLSSVRAGNFYGWPYALTTLDRRVQPDPSFGEKKPDAVQKTTAPDVPVQAHSAALGVAWYEIPGMIGRNIGINDTSHLKGSRWFSPEFNGDAFIAFHGSWNRSAKTGYKIVRVHFENEVPVRVSDFVRGFQNGDNVWGRPVDITVAPDGSLLFSDDGGGKIWRVSKQ